MVRGCSVGMNSMRKTVKKKVHNWQSKRVTLRKKKSITQTCSPSFCADRERGMHCAVRLNLSRSSGFDCDIGMLTHPGMLLGQGALLVPHPCVWLDLVSVKSWSMNEPHAMVMWVKLGAAPTFSEVPTNTVLLMVLAFLSWKGLTTEANLGSWPFWNAAGTKRTNCDPADPCATLHRLLHAPLNVRYRKVKQCSCIFRGSQYSLPRTPNSFW